jgi:hypothetical protein
MVETTNQKNIGLKVRLFVRWNVGYNKSSHKRPPEAHRRKLFGVHHRWW